MQQKDMILDKIQILDVTNWEIGVARARARMLDLSGGWRLVSRLYI